MSEVTIPDDFEDVKPMQIPGDELVDLWKRVAEERAEGRGHADPELVDLQIDLWQSIRRRSQAQEPECPDCGHQKWGQTMGNPAVCGRCSREARAEMEEAIHEVWDRMKSEVRSQGGDVPPGMVESMDGDRDE
jgi:hypothetical protein